MIFLFRKKWRNANSFYLFSNCKIVFLDAYDGLSSSKKKTKTDTVDSFFFLIFFFKLAFGFFALLFAYITKQNAKNLNMKKKRNHYILPKSLNHSFLGAYLIHIVNNLQWLLFLYYALNETNNQRTD